MPRSGKHHRLLIRERRRGQQDVPAGPEAWQRAIGHVPVAKRRHHADSSTAPSLRAAKKLLRAFSFHHKRSDAPQTSDTPPNLFNIPTGTGSSSSVNTRNHFWASLVDQLGKEGFNPSAVNV